MSSRLAVIADFELFTSDVSVRTRGYTIPVRPNHYFAELQTNAIGQVSTLDDKPIALGETKKVRVDFAGWDALSKLLAPGLEWQIREGQFVVGRATVIEVIRDEI
jgi:hypothetical protein